MNNNLFNKFMVLIIICGIINACNTQKPKENERVQENEAWALTSFVKVDSINPIPHNKAGLKF